jgi:hypothetical protein
MKMSCGCEVSDAEILQAAGSITREVNRRLSTGRRPGRPRLKLDQEWIYAIVKRHANGISFRKLSRELREVGMTISPTKLHHVYREAVQKSQG